MFDFLFGDGWKKLGRNPRSDRDLCEKGDKSPKKIKV